MQTSRSEWTGAELILGGQKSGKSRRAEMRARDWLAASKGHRAVLVATGQAHDEEMRERIARHQRDRAERAPGLVTVEEPLNLAQAIAAHSAPNTLLIVDCLTLWLTNQLMPVDADNVRPDASDGLIAAMADARGPLIFVSNEIGLGVIPMGRDVRAFVDALGVLNQRVAAASERVTFMAAGLSLVLKGSA